jgi:hypothetical protein
MDSLPIIEALQEGEIVTLTLHNIFPLHRALCLRVLIACGQVMEPMESQIHSGNPHARIKNYLKHF